MRFTCLVVLAACGTDKPSTIPDGGGGPDADVRCRDGAPSISFHTDVVPLVGHCGSELCHGGIGTSWPYTSLVNVEAYECTDHRMIVKPGDPMNSYLIQKLDGFDICMGVPMPKMGSPLAAADMQTLVDWICEGAPNN